MRAGNALRHCLRNATLSKIIKLLHTTYSWLRALRKQECGVVATFLSRFLAAPGRHGTVS